MMKHNPELAIFFSVNYLIFMLFLFGLLALPSPYYDDVKFQLCLILFIQAVVLVVLSFVGG